MGLERPVSPWKAPPLFTLAENITWHYSLMYDPRHHHHPHKEEESKGKVIILKQRFQGYKIIQKDMDAL